MERVYILGLKRAFESNKLSTSDFQKLFGARYFMSILNEII